MTIARGRLEPSQYVHTDVLVKFVQQNPQAKHNFYPDDFVRFGDMYSVNWLGLFAIAYHMTNGDPFFVGTFKTPGYEVKGGTMSRYARLAQSVSEQYQFGQHFVDSDITLGSIVVKGSDIEKIIQQVVKFAELPPKEKERFPEDGRVIMPTPVKPVEEPKPTPVKRVPLWWRLVRKPTELVLGTIIGALLGQVPAIKPYAEQIVAMVLALIEHLMF